MVTILDVARRSNLSKTLVSRVLNNQKGVSAEARERILEAMRELNYRPNELARSLVLQKTDTIGVILDSLCTAYYFDLIKGMEEEADQENLNLVFCGSNNNTGRKRSYVEFFTRGRVDGVIVYGSFLTDEGIVRELDSSGFPFVLIENGIEGLDINNILVDNAGGACAATEHLIKMGCRQIMHFTGDMNVKVSLDRLNGYVKAMQSHGLPIGDGMIVYSGFTELSGYKCMKNVLNSNFRPEAIFFGADAAAYGAMRAVFEAGLSIPSDIAIVGFDDDIPESRDIVFPGLTTVGQPLKEMGRESIRMLSRNINNPSMKKEKTIFRTNLIIRETSSKGI